MYFDIDDNFFGGTALGANYPITIKVIYYDQGNGTWQLKFDAVGDSNKTAYTVTKTNTNTWKEKNFTVTDAYFGNRCTHATDFYLSNSDSEDDIFHLVEIGRSVGNTVPDFEMGNTIEKE